MNVINEIKKNMQLNDLALRDALNSGNMVLLKDLMIQRANLKDMLINELEKQIQDKVA